MKVFEISRGATIVEPLTVDGHVTFIHLGPRFCCLLEGDNMPDGTGGLLDVDLGDRVAAAEVVSDMLSVASVESFAPPQAMVYDQLTAPTLDDAKADAKARVKARHAEILSMITGDYSGAERDTWHMQMFWLERYRADASDVQAAARLAGLLPVAQRSQLEASGVDPAQFMAEKITGKVADAGRATMIANRTKSECYADIEAAQTLGELTAVMDQLPAVEAAAIEEFQAGV